jgi:hypothetical protein
LVQACRNHKRNVSCPLIASLHVTERPPPRSPASTTR